MIRTYSVAGLLVSSPRAIPLLHEIPDSWPGAQARVALAIPPEWPEAGEPLAGSWEFEPLAGGFVVSAGDRPLIRYSMDRALEVAARVFEDGAMLVFLCKRVMPAIAGELGALPLHGAGVVLGSRAVALCARSGRGKTTLLHALLDAGAAFLTDDVLAAWPDGTVHPGPAFSNVVQEGAPHKRFVRHAEVWSAATPLGDVVSLEAFGPFALTRVSGSAALMAVLGNCYFTATKDDVFPWSTRTTERFRSGDDYLRSGRVQRDMRAAAQLVQRTRVWHVSYPHGLERLGDVARQLIAELDATR